LREQRGRPAGPKETPLDFGDLEMGIDRMVDLDHLPLGPQGRHARLQRSESHTACVQVTADETR
jgi:hypothetical protein